ncbi:uncharacterized protein LOC115218675 [Octopus sinensis]|uniref:Uncharacterized protein LOC115218675 n=1 Tax=Octopus sinensis TaxID=2607531 RepID=A0A6P7T250_9MOLL|nr:uncharacterized protein LOC115218675 [Octopus sinensis]
MLGVNISNMIQASEKLCEDEDDILDGMPCLIQNTRVTNTSSGFQQLLEKGTNLFMQQAQNIITREEYNRKYCPLLAEGIEKLADFRCPEKFTKIMQNYGYNIMSHTCRSINSISSSVTISPLIPSINGCMGNALHEYRNCLSKLNPNLTLHKLSPRGQMDFMCRIGKSKHKELLTSCFHHFKNCEQFSTTMGILGFEISRWMEGFERLCQYEDVILENMPCFLENMMNLLNNRPTNELKEFQLLFEKGRHLFMQQGLYKISREEYFKKYCPILKNGIEKLTDFKCPEKFIKIMQNNTYYIMSDKCRSINNIGSVDSIFQWISLGDGCMEKAIGEFQKCISKLNLNSLNGNRIPRSQTELMCKDGSKPNELLYSCYDDLKKCDQVRTTLNILGINIFRLKEANEKLCKNGEAVFDGMPCFIQKITTAVFNSSMNGLKKFQRLFEKGKDLFMQQRYYKITREEYYKKYCPLLKEGIENMADFKCPEKITKLFQVHNYDIMSDKCRSINIKDSSGIKPLPNISFISLLFLILLFAN